MKCLRFIFLNFFQTSEALLLFLGPRMMISINEKMISDDGSFEHFKAGLIKNLETTLTYTAQCFVLLLGGLYKYPK